MEPFYQFSSLQPSQQVKLESCPTLLSAGVVGDDITAMDKKLKHNANERDRRRKINSLYYSLRCLLPPTDSMVGFASYDISSITLGVK
ncbi:transcription factor bHLH101-like protein [Cucumis melo var. makuwa]|uniref:Transcription factor bHLH101-like n=1 Tax=Cucumis melo var. makuwa TaxID=1194695 RepID=A0A5A7SIL4_CUCMM|nr:transcription factor bHLH101-like [Cucumis melo var. makuwa]TYK21925.1 transcription factor bHLH101-like protein [Cucumis melo var. makuwa]